jgi:hypothetical protein
MQQGKFHIVEFLVEYNDPSKSEGGPITVRTEDTIQGAHKLVDRLKANPEISGVQLYKQVTNIDRRKLS